uniref:Kinesin-like protein n=1 Tax=Anopheles farauti TaxID=69004 RepID=A0A182QCU8_9DIPT
MNSSSVPDTVQVVVRIRPLSSRELTAGHHNVIVQPNPGEPRLVARGTEEFTFSDVHGPSVSQEEVYDRSVRGLVLKLLEGFNVSILAYGQTGSGKTHTIGTSFDGHLSSRSGILPRALLDIFDAVNAEPTEGNGGDATRTSYRVFCSFMELYQEHVYDLLSPRNRYDRLLGIREDMDGVIVPGLTELAVSSAQEAFGWLMYGANCRATASTSMNKESNRSHTIFMLIIRSRRVRDATSRGEQAMISKLHFVDLAGSERIKKSQASGDRLRESIQINKGLLALGNVISALASSSGASQSKSARSPFVSYRDSKLTRLLQNSLGGNSITLMLACVSPADYNIEETISTLRYADRALAIRNKPSKTPPSQLSQSSSAAEMERLTKTVSQLRTENDQLRRRIATDLKLTTVGKNGTSRQLVTQNRVLHSQLQSSIEESTRNELRASIAENALGRLEPLVVPEASLPSKLDSAIANAWNAHSGYRKSMVKMSSAVRPNCITMYSGSESCTS